MDVAQSRIGRTIDREKYSEEAFDFLTLDECEKHFSENNIETKDKLSLLRTCVDLLNRLEDTQYHHFAGRVLLFLAKVIPLHDQSGLNLRSEFNVRELPQRVVENLHQIAAQNAKKDKQTTQLIDQDIEEGETLSDDESNEATPQEDSDKTFERFWKVQQILNQPQLLYDKNTFFTFRTHLDSLIYKMENKPADLKVWNLKDSYMTDPKAFSLQLNDVNLRRCFLLQILIVIQYLEMSIDSKPENYALDKGQQGWIATMIKKIYGILDTTPNSEEGRLFLGLVRHVLRREEMWNRWKNDKCPKEPKKQDEEEEMVNMRGTYHKRRKISDELGAAKAYSMHVIGSQEMTKLWNMKPSPKPVPDLGKYLNIPAEKQTENFKEPNYSFRVLRLLRNSQHFFSQTARPVGTMEVYLKTAADRYVESLNLPASNSTTLNSTPPTTEGMKDAQTDSSPIMDTEESSS